MTHSGSLLFLDIATRSGWAEGVPGERPSFGSIKLAPAGASGDEVLAGMVRFLGERIMAFPPRWIVYEAPLVRNQRTAELLMGLCGVVRGVSYRLGVRSIKQIHVSTVRSRFLPKGYPKGGPELKAAVIDEVVRRGFDPANDDEADALAGWIVAVGMIAPKVSPQYDPLLAGGRPNAARLLSPTKTEPRRARRAAQADEEVPL
ncbi:hypothetical protein [Kaistia sp. MMO-174]|uniref:hypothetical protein n=1 Tax=Kaistia sp. MMO-174 TaxID=3081256 RepID=UPI00301845F6